MLGSRARDQGGPDRNVRPRGAETEDPFDLMTPEFALSLSIDAIVLLIRGDGGWHHVGSLSPEVTDLDAEMARLRDRAEALCSAPPLRCKLVLPDAQIRYLTLETGVMARADRLTAARKALEGATPYPVSALAFDVSADGPLTHVAAVARETLDEAESFAAEHGFGPLAFVASPTAHPFVGEPFFGSSRAGRGLDLKGEAQAVVDLGPMPQTAPETDQPVPASSEAVDVAQAHPAPLETNTAPEVPPASAPEPESVPEQGPAAISDAEQVADQQSKTEAPQMPAPASGADPLPDAIATPEPGSRENLPSAPPPLTEPAVQTATEPPQSDAEAIPASESPEEEAVGFSSRRKPGQSDPISARRESPVQDHAPRLLLSVPSPRGATGQGGTERAASGAALPAAPTLSIPVPLLAHTTSAPPKAAQDRPTAQRVAGPPAGDISNMPQARPLRSRPARIGLLAAGFALASALGAYAVVQHLPELWSDLKRADLVGAEDPVATPILARAEGPTVPADFVSPASDVTASAVPGDKAANSFALPGDGLSGTDAAVLDALAAPETLTVVDETQPVAGQDLVIASLPAPRSLANDDPDLPLIDEDQPEVLDPEALADGVSPEDPQDTAAHPDTGTDLLSNPAAQVSALEEAAHYAATGIWQRVPEITGTPALIDLEDVYVASIDRTDLSQDAVALPAQTDLETDQPFGAISSPTAAGRQFDLDERGLVKASRDGTLNPDGILIYSGRPVKTPPKTPQRPSAADLAATETRERLAWLSAVRPRTRPGDLVAQTERVQLGGVVRSEPLSKRPRTRPESLKTEEQESQPATAQAVAVASKPRARPTNFANIVDRAQRTTAPAQTETAAPTRTAAVAPAAEAPVSVSPSIPSSASVARQATMERAINLRHINLIGVYGKPSDRRALVRLPSGRYVKVKVGDKIDGGRIVAIGDSQLQYQKGGRNTTLTLPNG